MNSERYRVLLVEDDQLDRMAFERLVRDGSLPYDWTMAQSVAQAQSILETDGFDVIISDYSLGDGTGLDILNIALETPLILVTGAGTEELAIKAWRTGAYDYLIKDVDRNYLKALPITIENAVKQKKTEDQLKQYHNRLVERTEQLAEEKELLSVMLSSMGDGVIAVDAEKRIILFNKVAEELLGWRFEEVEGKLVDEVFKVISEQTKKPEENPIDKVLRSGGIETGGEHDALVNKDGGECPISVKAAPIRKKDGSTVGIVVVIRDVSSKREIDRMKVDFIASVSHELRTPLTAIKASTATILRNPEMVEKTKLEFLSIIDKESSRLAHLVEDILSISKIEAGIAKIKREAVDIEAIIQRVLSSLELLAAQKNIELKQETIEGVPELQGDESKLESIITNLVGNAIKFTPEDGRVCVSIRQDEENVVVSVKDNGLGIPKEDLPKIFDRFYRVYRPGTQIKGTGLGLAIVKEIVAMHKGRIEVESEVGQGTTFSVFLPLNPEPVKQKEATAVS